MTHVHLTSVGDPALCRRVRRVRAILRRHDLGRCRTGRLPGGPPPWRRHHGLRPAVLQRRGARCPRRPARGPARRPRAERGDHPWGRGSARGGGGRSPWRSRASRPKSSTRRARGIASPPPAFMHGWCSVLAWPEALRFANRPPRYQLQGLRRAGRFADPGEVQAAPYR